MPISGNASHNDRIRCTIIPMLANLLPGLRHFRTPFAIGALLAFQLWLIFGNALPTRSHAHGILHRVYSLGEVAGRPINTAAIAFLLYLIGDIAKIPPERFAKFNKKIRKTSDSLSRDSRIKLFYFAFGAYPRSTEIPNGIAAEDVNLLVQKMRDEFPSLRLHLIAEHSGVYLEHDRLESEAEFRLNVALLSASSFLILTVTWSPWFLLGLVGSGILYRNGLAALRDANTLIVDALVGRLISSSAYREQAEMASARRERMNNAANSATGRAADA